MMTLDSAGTQLLDLQLDLLVEVAGHLGFADLAALHCSCRRARELMAVPEVTAAAIVNHGAPLLPHELKGLMHSMARKGAAWLDVVRILLCAYDQQQDLAEPACTLLDRQDWNEWALSAVEMACADEESSSSLLPVAELLYAKRVLILENPRELAIAEARRRAASRLPRRSANAGVRAGSHPAGTMTRHSADPALKRAAGLTRNSPSPALARITPSQAAVLKAHAPVLAMPSMATSGSSQAESTFSLAMPSMRILQRNSRNLPPHPAPAPAAASAAGAGAAADGQSGGSSNPGAAAEAEAGGQQVASSSGASAAATAAHPRYPSPTPGAGTSALPAYLPPAPAEARLGIGARPGLLTSPVLLTSSVTRAIHYTHPEDSEGLQERERPLADVHFIDDAALRNACHAGRLALVRMLLEQGADVHARDGMPLALAAGGGHLALVQYLVEHAGADLQLGCNKALAAAIASTKPSHLQVLSYLLERGSDVHAADNFALRWACSHGRLDVARLLLKHGANVHAGVEDALYHAAKNGHLDVVRLLLSSGASAALCQDAVLRAEERGHKQVALLLKATGRRRFTQRLLSLFGCAR